MLCGKHSEWAQSFRDLRNNFKQLLESSLGAKTPYFNVCFKNVELILIILKIIRQFGPTLRSDGTILVIIKHNFLEVG